MLTPIRIVHMDPDPIVHAGFSAFIAPDTGMTLLGSASAPVGLLTLVAQLQPDVAVTELDAPRLAVLKTIEEIRRRHGATRVLLLTDRDRAIYTHCGIRSGALGFVGKDKSAIEIRAAIRRVYYRSVAENDLDGDRDGCSHLLGGEPFAKDTPQLTPRQAQVLQHLSLGRSVKQIALLLKISTKTVDNHKTRLMKKLDIHDRVGLVLFAIRQGLDEP